MKLLLLKTILRFVEKNHLVFITVCFVLLYPALLTASEFYDDFSEGVVSEEKWQIDSKGDCKIDVIEDSESKAVARFRADNNARCEIVPRVFEGWFGDALREPYRKDRWYTFRVFLTEPWEKSEKNEVIAQWHSTRDKFFGDKRGRGPPLAIRVINGFFRISYGWDEKISSRQVSLARYTLWYGPVITGRWVTWKVHARWSYEDDGLLQIWMNDVLVADHTGPNTYNDIRGVYLKLGSYHPSVARTVLLDDVYIGDEDPDLGK